MPGGAARPTANRAADCLFDMANLLRTDPLRLLDADHDTLQIVIQQAARRSKLNADEVREIRKGK